MIEKPHVTLEYEETKLPSEAAYLAKDDPINPQQIRQFFQASNSVPSGRPASWMDQIQVVYSGPFVYLYIYDFSASTWRHLQF
jgi:hypothetical protein